LTPSFAVEDLVAVALLVQDVVELIWTITGDLVVKIRSNRSDLLLFLATRISAKIVLQG
jgi:hypothetical protein